MDLTRLLKSIAEKLDADFTYLSSEIEHRPSKGRVREIELVEQFLAKYVPGTIRIGHGEIVATSGDVSSESDIIFYETRTSPVLLEKTSYQVFPIECVYGVLEVKSSLDRRELEDAFKKITKIKSLPKVAYLPQSGPIVRSSTLYGREWAYFPTIGSVFAYDSIDLITLRKHLDELHANVPFHQRVDSVWVLKKGMIVNWSDSDGKVHPAPDAKTRLRAVRSENPLLLMTVQLQQLLLAGWMPTFNLMNYLPDAVFGAHAEP